MRTVLKAAAGVAVLFAVVLGLTFPTDQLVRWVLGRVSIPEGYSVTFERAHLRPWGLVLDGAAYRRGDGEAVLAADWLRLRPSWTALWHDRLGRPWHVGAGLFGGTIEARLEPDTEGQVIDLSWNDLDVASLLTALKRHDPLTGRSTGRAALRLPAAGPASGDGELTLRAAVWEPPFAALDGVPLHADTASLRWTLGDQRLEVASFVVRGEEMDVDAQGQLRLSQVFGASTLDVHLTIEPIPGAPLELRRLLDGLPRRPDGVRDFRLTGTLDVPRISPP